MMEITTGRGAIAHSCFYCEGVWLTEEAFNAVEIDPDHRQEIEKLFDNPVNAERSLKTRRCPTCPGQYLEIVFNDKLELDRCSRCKGIFFDKGELTGEDVANGENRKDGFKTYVALESAFWAVFLFFGNLN